MYEINLFVDFSYLKVLLLCTQKYKQGLEGVSRDP